MTYLWMRPLFCYFTFVIVIGIPYESSAKELTSEDKKILTHFEEMAVSVSRFAYRELSPFICCGKNKIEEKEGVITKWRKPI